MTSLSGLRRAYLGMILPLMGIRPWEPRYLAGQQKTIFGTPEILQRPMVDAGSPQDLDPASENFGLFTATLGLTGLGYAPLG